MYGLHSPEPRSTTTKMLSAHFSARSTGYKNSSDQRKNLWFIGKILAFRSVDAWKQSPIRLEKWQTEQFANFFTNVWGKREYVVRCTIIFFDHLNFELSDHLLNSAKARKLANSNLPIFY
jgi:hypothetical protein